MQTSELRAYRMLKILECLRESPGWVTEIQQQSRSRKLETSGVDAVQAVSRAFGNFGEPALHPACIDGICQIKAGFSAGAVSDSGSQAAQLKRRVEKRERPGNRLYP